MHNDYGNWILVLVNIVLFLYFLKSCFRPQTKTDWRTFRVFGAFIVALFAEMYGFPLTIYLLTSFFGNRFNLDYSHDAGHLLNKFLGLTGDPHFSVIHIASTMAIAGGFILIAIAWDVLYKAQQTNTLAISGPYKYIRHPQYIGFILIIVGFLLQWPTLITLLMAPILITMYMRLAKREEDSLAKTFGKTFRDYQKQTPAFFPSLRRLTVGIIKLLSEKNVRRSVNN